MTTTLQNNSVKLGVLTSGGDAQGMNAVTRAVVRTAIHAGAIPYAIHEGWQGAVDGGDKIEKMTWKSVSDVINQGGTKIGTARCPEFRERTGLLKATKNLLINDIDRLVVIGGDGSLSGADELRDLWPSLVKELEENGELPTGSLEKHPRLILAGVVGSIDNDLVGTDMTVGADSALHRIIEAIDAISSTAASHQRSFVIEVMGRHCGYLPLMAAIAGGCDYVLIPEVPPAPGWEDEMCARLKEGRAAGRRDSIVLVAEGTTDRNGEKITSDYVRQVLEERLQEDTRVTLLGHVQRGGTPSAYDRWMSTLLGYTAALEVINANEDTAPCVIATRNNRLARLPLMTAVKNTRNVKNLVASQQYDKAVASRGGSFGEMLKVFEILASPIPHIQARQDGKTPRVAIMHAGGLAPGMNTAARTAVRLGTSAGMQMLGITGGFPGFAEGIVKEINWADVEGWSGEGGAVIGTHRSVPTLEKLYFLSRTIETQQIDALILIGGLNAYEGARLMINERDRYPAFRIPIICVPASIDNNLPGSELSIGADTALNNNAALLDRMKQSAAASRRCFVAETMGRNCGYLALLSAITAGAEQVYLNEIPMTLASLADDTNRMVKSFESGRRLYLVVNNENSSHYYTTQILTNIFEEEGHGIFDVRPAVLGHQQQGGNPSPFDRILATRLVYQAMKELDRELLNNSFTSSYVGLYEGAITAQPFTRIDEHMDWQNRRPTKQWWMAMKDVVEVVSDQISQIQPQVLELVIDCSE